MRTFIGVRNEIFAVRRSAHAPDRAPRSGRHRSVPEPRPGPGRHRRTGRRRQDHPGRPPRLGAGGTGACRSTASTLPASCGSSEATCPPRATIATPWTNPSLLGECLTFLRRGCPRGWRLARYLIPAHSRARCRARKPRRPRLRSSPILWSALWSARGEPRSL
jgi:hypothetical protein